MAWTERGASRFSRAVVVAASLAICCIANTGCSSDTEEARLRVEGLDYKLLPGGARIVSGTVHNDGQEVVRVAQVQISLFDDKNRRVDRMYAVIRDVPAGESVSFREPVQSEHPVSGARVKSIILID